MVSYPYTPDARFSVFAAQLTLPSNIFCFLYPAYASYKALSTPSIDPAGDILIERWLMYWAVMGTWTGVEALAGWLFTWWVQVLCSRKFQVDRACSAACPVMRRDTDSQATVLLAVQDCVLPVLIATAN